MSAQTDEIFGKLFRVLGYDKLSENQLMVKLFESNLEIKTLKEEIVELGASRDSFAKGLDDLKKEFDLVKKDLHDALDTNDMLEGVVDRKQQIIDSEGFTPSLLVKSYSTTSKINSNSPYCGGIAYTESGILKLESKLERAQLDCEELDIENQDLTGRVKSLEAEIEFMKSNPSEYQIQQDYKIKQLILSGEGLEKDYDELIIKSQNQEDFIERQKSYLSILHQENDSFRNIIEQQKHDITKRDEHIKATLVGQLAQDAEIYRLKKLITENSETLASKDLEISQLKETSDEQIDLLALKDEIIEHYSQFF